MSRGGRLCISFGVTGKLGVFACLLKLTKVMQLILFTLVHLLGLLMNVSSGCSFPIVGTVLADLGMVDFFGRVKLCQSNCDLLVLVVVVCATLSGVVLTTILYFFSIIYILNIALAYLAEIINSTQFKSGDSKWLSSKYLPLQAV